MRRTGCKRLAVAAGALALAACDASSPPDAAVSPSEEEATEQAAASAPDGESTPSPLAEAEAPPPVDPATLAAGRAIRATLSELDPYARTRELATLLPTLGPEAVPAVEEVLRDPTLNPGGAEIELLLHFWATQQPREATRFAIEDTPRAYRAAGILSALTVWAAADPQAAALAVQGWQKMPDARDVTQIGLVRGWFERDPAELADYIYQLGVGIARQRSLSTYIRLLLQRQGTEAAIRWVDSIPEDDPVFKLAAYRQLASNLLPFDHQAALRWCEANCEGPHGKDLRALLAVAWVRKDPVATFAWLSAAPEGQERSAAVRGAFTEWGRRDPEAALAWVKSRAPEPGGDFEPWLRPILGSYTRLLARSEPAEAIEWAETLEDEGQRERMLIQVAREWRLLDEAAADAWLVDSPLSEEAREKARVPAPVRRRDRGRAGS